LNQWRYNEAFAIASDPRASAAKLHDVHERWIPMYRRIILKQLAKNPATPTVLLEEILDESERLGRDDEVNQVGAHPNATQAMLERITSGPRGHKYSRVGGVAKNRNITPAIAARLAAVRRADFDNELEYSLYQSEVLGNLVNNPATPEAVFNQIAATDSPDYFLVVAVIGAERASCAQIRYLLEHFGTHGLRVHQQNHDILRDMARRRGC
jgi:hypothetical protein